MPGSDAPRCEEAYGPPASWAPGDGDLAREVRRQLLARRIVLVHGTLDDGCAAQVSATLLMLDASGDERIVVQMTGVSASVDAALVVVDVLDVCGVPVDVVAGGTIEGGAVGILAVCRHRTLAPHARLVLREPDRSVAGRAAEIERQVAAQTAQRDRFVQRVAQATGRPRGEVDAEWAAGSVLEPADALTLGYADEVATARTERAPGDGPA